MTFVLVIGYAPYSKASRNKPNKAAVSIGMPMVRVVPLDQLNEIQIGEYPGRFTCTETQTSVRFLGWSSVGSYVKGQRLESINISS
jgi:hypothetical protein